MLSARVVGLPIVAALIGSASAFAVAQPAPPKVDGANPIVNIDIDRADINTALKLLFKQANVSYFIDPALKSKPFSAGLHSIPFRTALDTLLDDCGESLDYSESHGVFRIFPLGPTEGGLAGEVKEKFGIIRPNQTTAESMQQLLSTAFRNDPFTHLTFSAAKVQNTILVRYPDNADGEATFREAQTWARLYDIRPKVIECQVQIDCSGNGVSGGKQGPLPVLTLTNRANDESTTHFKISSTGSGSTNGSGGVDVCSLGLEVKPGINGDGTMTLSAPGTLNLCVRLPGESNVRHVQTVIDYGGTLNGGNTIVTSAPDLTRPVSSAPLTQNFGNTVVISTIRLAGANKSGVAQNVQIRVLVTANIVPSTFPQQLAGN